MKSLKQICEDSLTHSLYEVSILGDIDDQIEAADKSIKDIIEKWIKENYILYGKIPYRKNIFKISKKPNRNGLYEVSCNITLIVKNKNITSLTNGMFEWIKVQAFDCSKCYKLESLEGAPKEIERNFDCSYCTSLESLEGAPQKVGGYFNCSECANLKSLKGAPKHIEFDFYCFDCTSLKSLEGAPEKVGGSFYCNDCTSLTSLEGAPEKVGGKFNCSQCKTKFTKKDVINVSDVQREIIC